MSAESNLVLAVEQEAAATHKTPSFFQPELQLSVLTWVTFFLLLYLLKKYAWGPILSALESREQKIRSSLDEAEKTHAAFINIETEKKKILDQANLDANETILKARKTAQVTAKSIEQKAHDEAQITLDNTQKEIAAQMERAEERLKQESAAVAVHLAEKLISENLNEKKNRDLIDRLIKDL